MQYNRLGFDFSNLQSCTLYRKNRMFSMVFIILFVTFIFISITFLWLYLTDSPVNVNNVPMTAEDPDYDSFFTVFLGIFFGLSFLFLAISIVTLSTTSKPYLYLDSYDLNSESFYYITKFGRNNEIYLTKNYAIKYSNFTKYTEVIKNPNEIEKLFNKYVPWYGLTGNKITKIDQRKKNTVIKVKYPNSYLTRVFKFSNDINIVPTSFSVSDVYITAVSRKTTGFNKYTFDLVNRAQHFEIHPEIKKELHRLAQSM